MRTVATCCDHTREASSCARGATDAGASTATGSDLSPCGRAKAGLAGHAGCRHQACLQCWPYRSGPGYVLCHARTALRSIVLLARHD